MVSTTIFAVRHGETVWHGESRYAGSSDVELTENGRAQAERLGAWAAGAGIDAIRVSPLSRARLTAAPAADALGLTPTIEPRLREMHFGVAEGRRLAELPVRQAVAFRADPVAGAFPGAEDPRAAAARGVAALRAAAERHDGRRILVVSHSTLLRLALCELLGIPLSRYRVVFPTLPNCAPAELRVDGPDTALLTYNVPV